MKKTTFNMVNKKFNGYLKIIADKKEYYLHDSLTLEHN